MLKKFMAMFMLSGVLVLGACNTVEGAGKDLKSAGGAIEGAAD